MSVAVQMKFNDHEVGEMLANLAALGKGRLMPALRSVGEAVHSAVITAFENEESPSGKKWQKSQRAKAKGGQTLTDSERLKGSIVVAEGGANVEVGTNAVYAAIHQFGGYAGRGRKVKMPERPFLPDPDNLSADLRLDILDTLETHLVRALS